MKPLPERKTFKAQVGTYYVKTLKGQIVAKAGLTYQEACEIGQKYNAETHETVRILKVGAGQGLVEYAFVLALVALVCFLLMSWAFGTTDPTVWRYLFLHHPVWAVYKEFFVRLHMLWLLSA